MTNKVPCPNFEGCVNQMVYIYLPIHALFLQFERCQHAHAACATLSGIAVVT